MQAVQLVERRKNDDFRQRHDLALRQSKRNQADQAQALAEIQKCRDIQKLIKEEGRLPFAKKN